MHCVLRFKTDLFDVAEESPNPINPIPGQSLLFWLGERLQPGTQLTLIPEDWGWAARMTWQGQRYLLGASAGEKEADGRSEWILHIVRRRTLLQFFRGEKRPDSTDACVQVIRTLLENEPAFHEFMSIA